MKKFSIEIKWGILFILSTLLWIFFEKALGWHDELVSKHFLYTNLFAIIAVLIYVLALREKRAKFYNGKMTWQQGFVSGIVMTIVVAVFTPLTQYLVHEVISPSYFDNIISYSVDSGRMTQEKAEEFFNLNSYIIQSIFMALGAGVVTSAIVAFFLKKK